VSEKRKPPPSDRAPKKSASRSTYTPELAREICTRIAVGDLSLTKLCDDLGMPALRTAFNWLATHEDFAKQMAEAREMRADLHRDKIEDLVEQVIIEAPARAFFSRVGVEDFREACLEQLVSLEHRRPGAEAPLRARQSSMSSWVPTGKARYSSWMNMSIRSTWRLSCRVWCRHGGR